jgi:hypothetical protein
MPVAGADEETGLVCFEAAFGFFGLTFVLDLWFRISGL